MGFRVVSVTREHTHDGQHDGQHDDDEREVVVEGVQDEQACPDCGVLSGKVHGLVQTRITRRCGSPSTWRWRASPPRWTASASL